jgi:hypothetical protein
MSYVFLVSLSIVAQQGTSRAAGIAIGLACILVLSTVALIGAIGLRRHIDRIEPDPKRKR